MSASAVSLEPVGASGGSATVPASQASGPRPPRHNFSERWFPFHTPGSGNRPHLDLKQQRLQPFACQDEHALEQTERDIGLAQIMLKADGTTGFRYLQLPCSEFLDKYDSLTPTNRSLCTLVLPGHPVHIYFDLDGAVGPGVQFPRPAVVRDAFVQFFTACFQRSFGRLPDLSGMQWETACSSTKFSLHCHITSEAFANVDHLNCWVKGAFVPFLESARDNQDPDALLLFYDKDNKTKCLMDAVVYTPNRPFRLFGCRKPEKTPLTALEDTKVAPRTMAFNGLINYALPGDTARHLSWTGPRKSKRKSKADHQVESAERLHDRHERDLRRVRIGWFERHGLTPVVERVYRSKTGLAIGRLEAGTSCVFLSERHGGTPTPHASNGCYIALNTTTLVCYFGCHDDDCQTLQEPGKLVPSESLASPVDAGAAAAAAVTKSPSSTQIAAAMSLGGSGDLKGHDKKRASAPARALSSAAATDGMPGTDKSKPDDSELATSIGSKDQGDPPAAAAAGPSPSSQQMAVALSLGGSGDLEGEEEEEDKKLAAPSGTVSDAATEGPAATEKSKLDDSDTSVGGKGQGEPQPSRKRPRPDNGPEAGPPFKRARADESGAAVAAAAGVSEPQAKRKRRRSAADTEAAGRVPKRRKKSKMTSASGQEELPIAEQVQARISTTTQPHFLRVLQVFLRHHQAEPSSDSPAKLESDVIHCLNEKWCIVTQMTKPTYVETDDKSAEGYIGRDRSSFLHTFEDWAVPAAWLFRDGARPIKLAKLWINSDQRSRRQRFVFDPSETGSPWDYQLYKGLAIDKERADRWAAEHKEECREAARPALDHIRDKWCRKNPVLSEYVLNWMALMVQKPWVRPKVAIVLRGNQGSGKGILVELLKKIVGATHSVTVHRSDDVVGRFTGALKRCVLLFVDEAISPRNQTEAGRFKALVTEPTHTVEDKFLPAVHFDNFMHIIMASNEWSIVHADKADRRSVCLEVDDLYCGSQTPESKLYFDALAAVPPEAFAKVLYDRDLTNFNPSNVPQTPLLRQQKLHTASAPVKWWHGCLDQGQLFPGQDWPQAAVPKWRVLEAYASENGLRARNDGQFWKELISMLGDKHKFSKVQKVPSILFPTLEQCKTAFRKDQADMDWPFESDAQGVAAPAAEPDLE
jgi:hypothetical protein